LGRSQRRQGPFDNLKTASVVRLVVKLVEL